MSVLNRSSMLTDRRFIAVCAIGGLLCIMPAWAGSPTSPEPPMEVPGITPEMLDQMNWLPGDLAALPEVPVPADNPQTQAKIELGKMLYFDPRLSRDMSTSCATCHHPDKGYGDGLPLAKGFNNKILGRHSPSVLNAAFNEPQFWDGRASGLEAQAVGPIMAAGEMNMPSEEEVIRRVDGIKEYRQRFQDVFGASPSLPLIGKAIASYERTVVSTNSRFDQYMKGDKQALTNDEKAGLALYIGKANCSACHTGANFTDNKFHNLGLHDGKPGEPDAGRFAVTKKEEDRGAFKTPTLRGVEVSGPYMHDGSLATLEDVVAYYSRGGGQDANKSKLVLELGLTDQEQKQLVAFLKTLTGQMPDGTAPRLPEAGSIIVTAPTDNQPAEH
jgi:cytochrome c peroxidase